MSREASLHGSFPIIWDDLTWAGEPQWWLCIDFSSLWLAEQIDAALPRLYFHLRTEQGEKPNEIGLELPY